jgi:hypothetical protein
MPQKILTMSFKAGNGQGLADSGSGSLQYNGQAKHLADTLLGVKNWYVKSMNFILFLVNLMMPAFCFLKCLMSSYTC